MKKVLFSIILAVISISTQAENRWHSSTIKRVYPLANGNFSLIFTSNHGSCTNPNDPQYFYVNDGENSMTPEGLNKIYSAALAAAAMGKTVTINFSDDTSGCYINRLWVNY